MFARLLENMIQKYIFFNESIYSTEARTQVVLTYTSKHTLSQPIFNLLSFKYASKVLRDLECVISTSKNPIEYQS